MRTRLMIFGQPSLCNKNQKRCQSTMICLCTGALPVVLQKINAYTMQAAVHPTGRQRAAGGSHPFPVRCTPCSRMRLILQHLRILHSGLPETHNCTPRTLAPRWLVARMNHRPRIFHHLPMSTVLRRI